MEDCDQGRCIHRATCGEYRRLNKAVYSIGKEEDKPEPSPDVDAAVEKALLAMEHGQQFDAAAEARISAAYKTGGAADGRAAVRIEIRREQNRMTPPVRGVTRTVRTPATTYTPIPRRPKVKAEKRPSHKPKGRGKGKIGGRE